MHVQTFDSYSKYTHYIIYLSVFQETREMESKSFALFILTCLEDSDPMQTLHQAWKVKSLLVRSSYINKVVSN